MTAMVVTSFRFLLLDDEDNEIVGYFGFKVVPCFGDEEDDDYDSVDDEEEEDDEEDDEYDSEDDDDDEYDSEDEDDDDLDDPEHFFWFGPALEDEDEDDDVDDDDDDWPYKDVVTIVDSSSEEEGDSK